ncbi:hypothetical protein CRE_07329 [Caenorhabditis remanei]|uniref:Uncharacterized protein n=1 Tax=Caenorhabditis remanei TaxID=31234 RepID=E3M280_CAERE|nr:hypothetical protein CRE_07329 [Caenorhabditis remanei]
MDTGGGGVLQLHQDSRPQAPGYFCSICQTHGQLTGKPRPARNVVCNTEDAKKIQELNQMEISEGGTTPMTEFKKVQEEELTNRWMINELTEKDEEMIDSSQLTHRRCWKCF